MLIGEDTFVIALVLCARFLDNYNVKILIGKPQASLVKLRNAFTMMI